MRLGFLEYVEKAAPIQMIVYFRKLRPGGADQKLGYYFTKWWSRYRKDIGVYEKRLEERRILTRSAMDELRAKYTQQLLEASKRVREEPQPRGEEIWKHVFAETDLVREGLAQGPAQFNLNGSLGRTFRLKDRYSLDLRVDSTNPINHVTFTAWNTTINSPQFGTPVAANAMRSLQTTLRLRF